MTSELTFDSEPVSSEPTLTTSTIWVIQFNLENPCFPPKLPDQQDFWTWFLFPSECVQFSSSIHYEVKCVVRHKVSLNDKTNLSSLQGNLQGSQAKRLGHCSWLSLRTCSPQGGSHCPQRRQRPRAAVCVGGRVLAWTSKETVLSALLFSLCGAGILVLLPGCMGQKICSHYLQSALICCQNC